jgi:hypothetical protein
VVRYHGLREMGSGRLETVLVSDPVNNIGNTISADVFVRASHNDNLRVSYKPKFTIHFLFDSILALKAGAELSWFRGFEHTSNNGNWLSSYFSGDYFGGLSFWLVRGRWSDVPSILTRSSLFSEGRVRCDGGHKAENKKSFHVDVFA